MQFRILGPLEVLDAGREVALGGRKQRALLALLVVHANETLTTDRLIDELWGERPPATAAKTVQMHVSRLRKALAGGAGDGAVGDGPVVTRERGYELRLDPERLDSQRFERLVGEARGELAAGRPGRGAALLEEALSLWRGAPLADLAHEPFAQREIARLEDLRVAALEALIEAKLELGRHGELVPRLEALIGEHPYRERFRAQLMLALYRSDRQADALQVYQDARRQLVEELGIEPGERLRELERAILAQDPALASPAAETAGLPPELDVRTLLAGRDAELEWLREHRRRAHAGAGRLVLVAGQRGMGKTRLAAELAGEVDRDRGAVRYASGADPPAAVRALRAAARAAPVPTLLVLDDVDGVQDELRAPLAELIDTRAGLPVLVLATAEDPALAPTLGADATLTLAPLDANAIRAVARLYAARSDVEFPVGRLAKASGGVPQQVHRAAAEWARAEATRRLGAAAGRAESERTGLRAAEEELAGRVGELQVATERAELADGERRVVACPFKGLASFDVEDAELFFGRERLVAEMVARLPGAPLMGIVGPSGSGKSSALRAGLLAALAGGVLPGSERWALALLRPGEHPLEALEQATAAAAGRDRLVVAVDQFEEAFAMCHDESERAAFVDALVGCARDQSRPAVVLVAVRADFYGRCAAYPELSLLLGANHVLVGPMRRGELRRAIELPARRAGLRVEPELVDALVADVDGQPGALPLLSTSLLELWQRRDGRRLHLSAYEHAGGVRGAVARLAEGAYRRLDPDRRQLARRILLRLAGEGEGDTVVRRRVQLAELDGGHDDRVADVLAALARERLVSIGEGEVEVAHEALLREWPRLRGWLEEDAQGRRLHRHLIDAARTWHAGGRDPGDLYRGARLAVAREWRVGHEHELNSTERAFLDVSRVAAERAQRRLWLALAGVAALLAVAVAGGLVAVDQRTAALNEARAAEAQRIGVQALTEPDLDRSLLLARQGVAIDDSPATRSNLLAALLRAPAAIGVMRGTGNPLSAIDVDPDGRTLAVGDSHGNLVFLDAVTRRRVWRLSKADTAIVAARFSPDGTRVAVAGYDVNQQGFIELLDTRMHHSLGHLATGFDTATTEEAVFHVGTVVFSPDSRVLAADFLAAGSHSPPRRYVARWDARTGRRLGPPRRITSHADRAPALAGFIAGGKRLVTSGVADGSTVIRDATTLRPVRRLRGGGSVAAVSPDGRVAALALRSGTVRLLDLRSGSMRELTTRQNAPVTAMRFSPDSRTLVTAGGDAPLIVWDVRRGAPIETFQGHAGPVEQLAIAPDGRTAYSAGRDGSVLGWDLAGTRRLGRPFRIEPPTPSGVLAVTTAGPTFAVPNRGGHVDLLDSRTLTRTRRIGVRAVKRAIGRTMLVAITPDARTMAATTGQGEVSFIDLHTGQPLGPPTRASASAVRALAFSADGRWLATSGEDQAIYVWDVRRQSTVGLYVGAIGPTISPATSLSVSPDGSKLVTTVAHRDGSGELNILSMPRLALLARVPAAPGRQTQFSRDGRLLFYGDDQGRVWIYDTRTWKPRGRPLAGHASPGAFALRADERVLATTASDGTTRLWDVPSGRPIGTALPGAAGQPVSAAFVNRGRALVTLHGNGRGYVWNVQPQSWAQRACAIAGRRLTRPEWQDALPARDYAPACADR